MKPILKHLASAIILLSISISLGASELQLTESNVLIRISKGGKPVLEYIKSEKPVPEGLEKGFRRSGYVHPVFSPKGQEVTGDFPLDHAHQHALFFAWTKATYDGESVDFWNQLENKGRIEHRGVLERNREKNRVSFSVRHAFVTGPEDKPTDALYETWKVTVYQTPEDYFLFDVESVQECASDKPFRIEEYHYGGMAFRGNYEWFKEKDDHSINPGDLQFITSEGKDRWQGNHTRPTWVSMTGLLDGQETSVTVMGSPDNFRAPQHIRIHPSKPYFCFAPMVAGEFNINPREKYVSKYRYLVTSKPLDQNLIDTVWKEYTQSSK
jgi:hypothetical protein